MSMMSSGFVRRLHCTRKSLGQVVVSDESARYRSRCSLVSKRLLQASVVQQLQQTQFSLSNGLKPVTVTGLSANTNNCCSLRHVASQTNTNPGASESTKVLYDGDCKLCKIEISALKRYTRNKSGIEFVDISEPSYSADKYSGVTYETAMKEMHVIGPSGQVLTQGDAIRQMYRASGFGWLASFTELPGIRPICDRLYVKFAAYRLNKALNGCDDGSCSIKLQHFRKQYRNQDS